MLRIVSLSLALSIAACKKEDAGTASTSAKLVAQPGGEPLAYAQISNMIPAASNFVAGIDVNAMRSTQVWPAFASYLDALDERQHLATLKNTCGIDLKQRITNVWFAAQIANPASQVFFVNGLTQAEVFECIKKTDAMRIDKDVIYDATMAARFVGGTLVLSMRGRPGLSEIAAGKSGFVDTTTHTAVQKLTANRPYLWARAHGFQPTNMAFGELSAVQLTIREQGTQMVELVLSTEANRGTALQKDINESLQAPEPSASATAIAAKGRLRATTTTSAAGQVDVVVSGSLGAAELSALVGEFDRMF